MQAQGSGGGPGMLLDVVQLVSSSGLRHPRTLHSFDQIVFVPLANTRSGCYVCSGALNPFTAKLCICLHCRECAHRRCIKNITSRCAAAHLTALSVLPPPPPSAISSSSSSSSHSSSSSSAASTSNTPPPPLSPSLSLSPSLALRDVGKRLRGLVDKVRQALLIPDSTSEAPREEGVAARNVWDQAVMEICRARAASAQARDEDEALAAELAAVVEEAGGPGALLPLLRSRVLSSAESSVGRGLAKLHGLFMLRPFPADTGPFDDDWHDNPALPAIAEARACLDAALLLTLSVVPGEVLDDSAFVSDAANLVDGYLLAFAEQSMYGRVARLCALRATSRRYALDVDKIALFLQTRAEEPSPQFDLSLARFHLMACLSGSGTGAGGPASAVGLGLGIGSAGSGALSSRDKAVHLVRALQCVSSTDGGGGGQDGLDADELLHRFTQLLLADAATADEAAETLRCWVAEVVYLGEMQRKRGADGAEGGAEYGIREYALTVLESAVMYFVVATE